MGYTFGSYTTSGFCHDSLNSLNSNVYIKHWESTIKSNYKALPPCLSGSGWLLLSLGSIKHPNENDNILFGDVSLYANR